MPSRANLTNSEYLARVLREALFLTADSVTLRFGAGEGVVRIEKGGRAIKQFFGESESVEELSRMILERTVINHPLMLSKEPSGAIPLSESVVGFVVEHLEQDSYLRLSELVRFSRTDALERVGITPKQISEIKALIYHGDGVVIISGKRAEDVAVGTSTLLGLLRIESRGSLGALSAEDRSVLNLTTQSGALVSGMSGVVTSELAKQIVGVIEIDLQKQLCNCGKGCGVCGWSGNFGYSIGAKTHRVTQLAMRDR